MIKIRLWELFWGSDAAKPQVAKTGSWNAIKAQIGENTDKMCRFSNWHSEYRRVKRAVADKDIMQVDLEYELNKSSEKFADGKEEKD